MLKLVLASKSPRRIEILGSMGYEFEIIPAENEERADFSLPVGEMVEALARAKAEEVFKKVGGETLVVGMDTVVALNGEILQKPKSAEGQRQMLRDLSGKEHEVWTGYCVLGENADISGAERSAVFFNKLSADEIEAYVQSGLGMDKAGGYGVQDGYGLVQKIEGGYYNVVGFPKEKMNEILAEFDLERVK